VVDEEVGRGSRDKAAAEAKAGRRYYSEDESDGDGGASDASAEMAAAGSDFFVHDDDVFNDPFFTVTPSCSQNQFFWNVKPTSGTWIHNSWNAKPTFGTRNQLLERETNFWNEKPTFGTRNQLLAGTSAAGRGGNAC
jgi:hypothetical protein